MSDVYFEVRFAGRNLVRTSSYSFAESFAFEKFAECAAVDDVVWLYVYRRLIGRDVTVGSWMVTDSAELTLVSGSASVMESLKAA